uniref:Uncharacterized protein n=1 Tax=Arundo donax TaxID=35708 RepID=A0A0A9G807_ARUDO
MSPLFSPPK